MRLLKIISLIAVISMLSARMAAQGDNDPPVSPLFTFLTVKHENGYSELRWQKSPSADVAGYVIYNFRNGEGFAIDTLWDPDATSYIDTGSASSYFSESYVIAAIDYSGNISPLSNVLETIFLQTTIDSCNNLIFLSWNSYPALPYSVTGYRVMVSENGGMFNEAGTLSPGETTFSVDDFETNVQYCFIVEAMLETGLVSQSNSSCLLTDMQKAPDWINADYATVDEDNNITLSFTVDPGSEISKFGIERRKDGDDIFTRISTIDNQTGTIMYTDKNADSDSRYFYRMTAINNCGIAIIYSNVATNIVAGVINKGDSVEISWTKYSDWLGGISHYSVFVKTGDSFYELTSVAPDDTTYSVNYAELMYEITGRDLCFYITASEGANPYGIEGESRSAIICTGVVENVLIANAFTPNEDNINDLFKPALSFTPSDYHFIISDIRNRILFETRDYEVSWDGKYQGSPLPQGVYLWFLRLKTPSGEIITRNGTVTILKNH